MGLAVDVGCWRFGVRVNEIKVFGWWDRDDWRSMVCGLGDGD